MFGYWVKPPRLLLAISLLQALLRLMCSSERILGAAYHKSNFVAYLRYKAWILIMMNVEKWRNDIYAHKLRTRGKKYRWCLSDLRRLRSIYITARVKSRLYQWAAIASVLTGIAVTMILIATAGRQIYLTLPVVGCGVFNWVFIQFMMGVDFPKSNWRFSRLT